MITRAGAKGKELIGPDQRPLAGRWRGQDFGTKNSRQIPTRTWAEAADCQRAPLESAVTPETVISQPAGPPFLAGQS